MVSRKQLANTLKITSFMVIAFLIGFLFRGANKPSHQESQTLLTTENIADEHVAQIWTCSMHPQIRRPGPGQCPICGMDLIPVTTTAPSAAGSERELSLSPYAVKLAGIAVAPSERKAVEKEIRLVGKVAYDETRVKTISAWFPGRIDRLYVDFTGTRVKEGEPLAEMYSPELYSAQEELLQAINLSGRIKQTEFPTTKDVMSRTVEAARKKLRLLGLTAEQIASFEKSREVSEHVTIHSTISGIVIQKDAVEGVYVDTGMKLYTIADLSVVWVNLDVYESDLEFIRLGEKVTLNAEAYPGETFTGKVAFIDPVLNDMTRTVKVRVSLPNPGDRLKPDMFVHAIVHSRLKLAARGEAEPLVIPASAPLITGKRAVVYVEVPGKENTYEGREVVLGQRAGDYYQVTEGLDEGELVVVSGNFKIDSAIQILARPSMMNPEGGITPVMHHAQVQGTGQHENHGTSTMNMKESSTMTDSSAAPMQFNVQLDNVYRAYFGIHHGLSHDSLDVAQKSAEKFLSALKTVDMTLLGPQVHMVWMKELDILRKSADKISLAETIDEARKAFETLSASMIRVAHQLGTTGKVAVYRFHCPMAFNQKGADWLQETSEIANPWFGSQMPKCGSLEETISTGTP